MASGQRDDHLRMVGLEGFGLIDQIYGPTRRPSPRVQSQQVHQNHYRHPQQHQHQQSCIYHGSQANTVRESVVNHSLGTTRQFYSIVQSVYQEPQVSAAEKAEISSNEAARVYGGMVMLSYTRTRPLR
ncbi:Uncharacterized protein TCM_021258 [Theobroma cacao]|uniref:Uncharacterized protein n=1 Tax=Theobroma cacao TaxID=3641 RepID=A0A061EQF8_THECC|nr:Uncharacterized protein TCM_021258 [Theobroma cacao]